VKKNDGARSGNAARNCRRRLPSIWVIVTKTARPRPSDITTDGVSAPGRWMLAIASRSMVMRVRGRRRASAISPPATPRNSANTRIEEATNTAAIRLS